MDELRDQCRKVESAIDKLRENKAGAIEDVVGILEDLLSDLDGHDCDDLASECEECQGRKFFGQQDLPNVRECLELGLPALVEKYGYDSNEVREAQGVIEQQG